MPQQKVDSLNIKFVLQNHSVVFPQHKLKSNKLIIEKVQSPFNIFLLQVVVLVPLCSTCSSHSPIQIHINDNFAQQFQINNINPK